MYDINIIVDELFYQEYKKIYPDKQTKIPKRKNNIPRIGDFIQQDEFEERFVKAQRKLVEMQDEIEKRLVY